MHLSAAPTTTTTSLRFLSLSGRWPCVRIATDMELNQVHSAALESIHSHLTRIANLSSAMHLERLK